MVTQHITQSRVQQMSSRMITHGINARMLIHFGNNFLTGGQHALRQFAYVDMRFALFLCIAHVKYDAARAEFIRALKRELPPAIA